MNFATRILRRSPYYKPLRSVYHRLRKIPRHPLQCSPTVEGLNFVHLGTEYGGWTFVDDGDLHGCTIISAGLGEDASFDVEFARKYDATVVIVDPTPRAIQHFQGISDRFGRSRARNYTDGGKQSVDSYELSNLGADNLKLITRALWNSSTNRLKFFEPEDSRHVSHSIINYSNNYSDTSTYIEVESITLPGLVASPELDGHNIPLVKLDIEGAEIEVLEQVLLESSFRPRQILVEFDELNKPSRHGFERVSRIHSLLKAKNYELVTTNGLADFLYLRLV